ncbi:hypothetical protein [Umezawaea sp.]|uniref:hypothetical protein n=1 Tax=Umezawaea sp. TaxID=1955258 RepID=UPI002ED4DEF2
MLHFAAIFVVFAAYARLYHLVSFDGLDWVQIAITSIVLKFFFHASRSAIWGKPEIIWSFVTVVVAIAGFTQGAKGFAGDGLVQYVAAWMVWNF